MPVIQVNRNFAISLVAEEPVSEVGARVVSCDGGGGALGHPKVYINLVGSLTPVTSGTLALGLILTVC